MLVLGILCLCLALVLTSMVAVMYIRTSGPLSDTGAGILAGFIAPAVLFLAVGVPNTVAGFGLLKLKKWARLLVIALSALCIVLTPYGVLNVLRHFQASHLPWQIAWVAIHACIIWYLSRLPVKQVFGASSLRP